MERRRLPRPLDAEGGVVKSPLTVTVMGIYLLAYVVVVAAFGLAEGALFSVSFLLGAGSFMAADVVDNYYRRKRRAKAQPTA